MSKYCNNEITFVNGKTNNASSNSVDLTFSITLKTYWSPVRFPRATKIGLGFGGGPGSLPRSLSWVYK